MRIRPNRRSGPKNFPSQAFDVFNVAFMVFLAFVTFYPFYFIAVTSLSDGKAVMAGQVSLFPVKFTLASYGLVLRDPNILRSYLNTLLYTTLGTIINLGMTLLCAYPLSRPGLEGKKWIMGFIVFTMFFSGGMIPTFLVVNSLKMVNTIWAMVIPGALSTYNMIVTRSFFQSLPEALHESAEIDGAGEMKILTRIFLPLSMPIIATMTLFYAVGHWNSYMNALLYLNDKKYYPIQSILRNMVVQGQMGSATMDAGGGSDFLAIDTTIKYAVIMVATLPIMLVYPFVQRYFVKGVMIGSIKG
ncbi:MAG: carbohydrate ABC transporter permease [Clostridiales bacterium]|jgi:putative aldouronate transport system permease protein|nr:carbohydrate ABC transporter permease [Clostridiales bacterium]